MELLSIPLPGWKKRVLNLSTPSQIELVCEGNMVESLAVASL